MRDAPIGKARLSRAATALITTMCLVDAGLAAYFVSQTGVRTYVVITVCMTGGATLFLYLALSRGVVYSRGRRIARDEEPTRFKLNMAVVVLLFLMVLGSCVGLFTQERDRLLATPPSRPPSHSR